MYTSLEVERLVNASGPTGGEIVLRDGAKPKTVGIIHCVGSRDHNTNRWCSKVCCMYSLKLAHLIRERTGAEVYNFYIDMRTPGKGYEEFYDRLLDEGVHFIRGRVAEVTDWPVHPSEEGKLIIRAEDTLAGFVRRIPVDMVVLSVGWNRRRTRGMSGACSTSVARRKAGSSSAIPNWRRSARSLTASSSRALARGRRISRTAWPRPAQLPRKPWRCLMPSMWSWSPIRRTCMEEACSGCKTCLTICPYTAISFVEETKKARVNEVLCKGCGTCVATCPSGSIEQNLFEDQEIFEEVEGLLAYA